MSRLPTETSSEEPGTSLVPLSPVGVVSLFNFLRTQGRGTSYRSRDLTGASEYVLPFYREKQTNPVTKRLKRE